MRYGAAALEAEPLGGSQSAMLVLADALAAAGAEVTVAALHLEHGARRGRVLALNLKRALEETMPGADVAVMVNVGLARRAFERLFARAPRVVHWHKNDALSPDAAMFGATERGHIEHVVFCSHFQASGFLARFGLPAARVSVIQDPLAGAFRGLFAPGESILAAKDPDLLVYASAPHRGLDSLVRVLFPELRRRRPGLRLEVYGAEVTGADEALLAARMRRAAMLCYPCSFRETSCHGALEAMAAGCLVSATDIGALPETTAGFARLTPFVEGKGFSAREFTAGTLALLEERSRDPAQVEARLRRQVAHVNAHHGAEGVAQRWAALLESLMRG